MAGNVEAVTLISGCYHCVRYEGSEVHFTAQGLVNTTLVVGGR